MIVRILPLSRPTALLAAALCVPAVALAQADFDRTLQTGSAPDLYVATASGTIRVTPGSDAQVHIHAHLHADWHSGADVNARMNRIAAAPPISQSGNAIHVGEVDPAQRPLYNGISIEYEISAPRAVALNLRTGSGELETDNLGRFLKADSGSGSIQVHGLSGPAELHSGSGDIDLQQSSRGDVRASTGSGSIHVAGLQGGLDAHTGSGDIEAGGAILASANLQTGSGSIHIHLGRDAHFTLQASTGSGSIHISQPGVPQGEEDRHRVNAPVNGGGPVLQARTGSGDIEIN